MAQLGGALGSDAAKELLEVRAQLTNSPKDLKRRLFAQFDAWTDPRLLKWINCEGKSLSREARELFYDGRPETDPDVLRCAFELFTCVPLDRARMLAAGGKYGVEAHVEGNVRLFLEESGLSLKKLVRKLAKHMHAIFLPHLPKKNLRVPRKLDEMFALFASGALRIEDGRQEFMNAEPDSSYFFAFAEFCIQAAHFRAVPGRSWWISLGGMFSALQDVFCQRYHRPRGERRFAEYRDVWFDGTRPISPDLLLKQVRSVRRRDTTIRDLIDRVTWNAYWYFFDDVQQP